MKWQRSLVWVEGLPECLELFFVLFSSDFRGRKAIGLSPLILRDGSLTVLLFGDSPAFSGMVVFPAAVSHGVPELPEEQIALIFFVVLSAVMGAE